MYLTMLALYMLDCVLLLPGKYATALNYTSFCASNKHLLEDCYVLGWSGDKTRSLTFWKDGRDNGQHILEKRAVISHLFHLMAHVN